MWWKLQASFQTQIEYTSGEGLQGVCRKMSKAKEDSPPPYLTGNIRPPAALRKAAPKLVR
jgi:hypothetical protein